MKQITATELKVQLDSDQQQPVLIDVREPWEYTLCHIEGSTLIPMKQLAEEIESMDRDKETVLICHTGVRSQVMCNHLARNGFTNVINLTGGVHAWACDVDTLMATY